MDDNEPNLTQAIRSLTEAVNANSVLLAEVVNNQRAEAALRLMDRGGNPFAQQAQQQPYNTAPQPAIVHPQQPPYNPQAVPPQGPMQVPMAWQREMKDGSGITHAGRMLLPGGEGTLIYQRLRTGGFRLAVENRDGSRTNYTPVPDAAIDPQPADPNRNVGMTGFDGPMTTAPNRE